MSILINGMEMPQGCNDCPLAGDFKCNLMPSIPALCKEYDMAVQNRKRLNSCPLIEIPPHGRLIDADAAVANRDADMNWCYDLYDLPDYLSGCPTIIEAEEGE